MKVEIRVTKEVYDAHRSELWDTLIKNPDATLVIDAGEGVEPLRIAVPRPKPEDDEEDDTPIIRRTHAEYIRNPGDALSRMVGFKRHALEVLDNSKTKVLFRVTMQTDSFDD